MLPILVLPHGKPLPPIMGHHCWVTPWLYADRMWRTVVVASSTWIREFMGDSTHVDISDGLELSKERHITGVAAVEWDGDPSPLLACSVDMDVFLYRPNKKAWEPWFSSTRLICSMSLSAAKNRASVNAFLSDDRKLQWKSSLFDRASQIGDKRSSRYGLINTMLPLNDVEVLVGTDEGEFYRISRDAEVCLALTNSSGGSGHIHDITRCGGRVCLAGDFSTVSIDNTVKPASNVLEWTENQGVIAPSGDLSAGQVFSAARLAPSLLVAGGANFWNSEFGLAAHDGSSWHPLAVHDAKGRVYLVRFINNSLFCLLAQKGQSQLLTVTKQ